MIDAQRLARQLVRIDTSAGNERVAAELCRDVLDGVGARTELIEMAPGRAHLLASVGDTSQAPLVLSGHLDTVPAWGSEWTTDPFSGDVRDEMLLGRGSTDMKGGVAALVVALAEHVTSGGGRRGVLLVLTAGEESGCEGARHLVTTHKMPTGGPLLVAEPTGLKIALGHKGVLWLRASATGRSAHGSRPDLGRNAIVPLARLVMALEEKGLVGEHPQMGNVTVNVGTFRGGTRINLVPDTASVELDIRVVTGIDPDSLKDQVTALAGPEVTFETMDDLSPIYSSPDGLFASLAASAIASVIGSGALRPPLPYFTDAAVLAPALDSSEVVILGPGNPEAAHTTNEQCSVAQIESAKQVYGSILHEWDTGTQSRSGHEETESNF